MAKALASALSMSRSGFGAMQIRGISTGVPRLGGWEMEIRRKSHLLDTSRNIEKEDRNGVDSVVLSKDARVIVCWHPEVPFPYEMSKPLPLDITPTDSNLKIQALAPVNSHS